MKLKLYYQDTELKAGIIIMDYIKNESTGAFKVPLELTSQLPFF